MRGTFALFAAIGSGSMATCQPDPPTFVHSRIDTTLGGWHATTRSTVRLVFVHRGRWLVFRGNPDAYHFSRDGVTWTRTEAEQASRSHLIDGDTIYTQYSVDTDPAPDKWNFKHYVAVGAIGDDAITWGAGQEAPFRLSYYPDIQRDTNGYFTMTGRAVLQDDAGEMAGEEMLWARTTRPDDFLAWGDEVRCFQHLGDAIRDRWTQVGSVAHENVALENGRSYILSMMTWDLKGLLLGRLHDGTEFVGDDVVLCENMSTVRGTDKRMCACFDPDTRTIHCAYVDHDGGLWYRTCVAPYGPGNWSEPERIGPENAFTTVMSLDRSQNPAHVWVLYGKTAYENPGDRRQTWGDLYLMRYDDRSWSDPVPVSEPDEHENWYPNMNEDVSRGFGILYLKGGQEGPTQDGKRILDIMFASTGPPS
jgi:hypothetical protein